MKQKSRVQQILCQLYKWIYVQLKVYKSGDKVQNSELEVDQIKDFQQKDEFSQ